MAALNARFSRPQRCIQGALAAMGLAIALAQVSQTCPVYTSKYNIDLLIMIHPHSPRITSKQDPVQSKPSATVSSTQSRGSPTSPLLLYYAFNETAGSSQVIDYSGNKFNATGHGWPSFVGTSTPAFTGTSMRLRSLQGQYLSIDKALGPVVKTLDSFTVTTSIKLPQVRIS